LLARYALIAIAMAVFPAVSFAQALDGRLKKIKDSKSIAIAYRSDAAPFSFIDQGKEPVGYSIDLCKRVVSSIEQQIGAAGLQVKWVPVTTQTRFEAIAKGEADMECGSSTVTLTRMKTVDFSNYIFIDGTGLIVRSELNARSLTDLGGKKIGVVGGTTNEKALAAALKERVVTANVVALKSRDEAAKQLDAKEIDAFASDTLLLLGLAMQVKDPKSLALLDETLSFEPYAITLPRNDSGLRAAVNTGLAQVYRGDAVVELYGKWFGRLGKPTPALRAVYMLGAVPE
jgi:ABC-type amino acid transport substrate-binding protein